MCAEANIRTIALRHRLDIFTEYGQLTHFRLIAFSDRTKIETYAYVYADYIERYSNSCKPYIDAQLIEFLLLAHEVLVLYCGVRAA